MKRPSISSVIIFSIFIIIKSFKFENPNLLEECIRTSQSIYNLRIFIPIYIILLLGSIFFLISIKRDYKSRILDIFLVSPIIINGIYLICRLAINSTIWME